MKTFLELKFKEIAPVILGIFVLWVVPRYILIDLLRYIASLDHKHYENIVCGCVTVNGYRYEVSTLVFVFIGFYLCIALISILIWILYEYIKHNLETAKRIDMVRKAGHKFDITWFGLKKH